MTIFLPAVASPSNGKRLAVVDHSASCGDAIAGCVVQQSGTQGSA